MKLKLALWVHMNLFGRTLKYCLKVMTLLVDLQFQCFCIDRRHWISKEATKILISFAVIIKLKWGKCYRVRIYRHGNTENVWPSIIKWKVKVSPIYVPYVEKGALVLGHRICEVRWPVPFLAAFISRVFTPGPHSLLSGQWASVKSLALSVSRTVDLRHIRQEL